MEAEAAREEALPPPEALPDAPGAPASAPSEEASSRAGKIFLGGLSWETNEGEAGPQRRAARAGRGRVTAACSAGRQRPPTPRPRLRAACRRHWQRHAALACTAAHVPPQCCCSGAPRLTLPLPRRTAPRPQISSRSTLASMETLRKW